MKKKFAQAEKLMESESSYIDSKDYKFFKNALRDKKQKSTYGEHEPSENDVEADSKSETKNGNKARAHA